MTEIPLLQTHAVPQLSPRAPSFAPVQYPVPNGRPIVDPSEPDDEPVSDTIKCICGYELDDGHSVFCELCRTWQHVHCYYDGKHAIPSIHECVDCHPRPMDMERVNERKERFRTGDYMIEDEKEETAKSRRPASKSHKKKVKDVNASTLPNGLSYNHDAYPGVPRKSGSPRDQQPPTKRPKTNHKNTGSVASLNHASINSRKRATSAAQPANSPVKSPTSQVPNGYSGDYFSPEFLQLYQRSDYDQIEASSYNDLGVTTMLRAWVSDPEETKKASGGTTRDQIFKYYNGDIKDLEKAGPQLKEHTGTGSQPTVQGLYPTWKWVTVESYVTPGSFVGELKGQIGRKEEYCSNPDNRWQTLRHPEPFVFFPPFLPLYIDTRNEGTLLRYIRRSCRPNVHLQIIITGDSEYHFCFVATEEIYAGDEISIAWNIDKDVQQALEAYVQNGNTHERGIQEVEGVTHWVAGVLSNFGGCACRFPPTDCLLARADLRNGIYLNNQSKHVHKRSRKNGNQVSPLSTGHATNSRAGSEARNRSHGDQQEDDNGDSRSVSGSSRSKPTSRDITPMTHVSNDNPLGLGVELSEREKRKLMQQEKLFEQIEHDEQHQKKRKRNSAGSALNTPSVATSRQLGHPESSFASPVAPSRSRADSRTQNSMGRRSNKRTSGRARREPTPVKKPQYQDSGMQTEPDAEFPSLVPVRVERRKPKASFLRSLLHRTHEDRVERERSESVKRSPSESRSHADDDNMDIDQAPSEPKSSDAERTTSVPDPVAPAPEVTVSASKASSPQLKAEEDVDMQDAPTVTATETQKLDTSVSPRTTVPPVHPSETRTQTSHPPLPPPPPPWSVADASGSDAAALASPPTESKATFSNLHIPVPPPTLRTSTPPPTTDASTLTSTGTVTGTTLADSPSILAPPAPISVSSPIDAPQPPVLPASPVQRKAKMSLSDWTAKRKAKEKAAIAEHDAPVRSEETRSEDKDREKTAERAVTPVPAVIETVEKPKMAAAMPAPIAPMTTEVTTAETKDKTSPSTSGSEVKPTEGV